VTTNPTPRETRLVSALTWILGLGVIGFAAGFIGPMVFAPEENQGPLLGIFISGPSSVCLGAILLVVTRLLRLSPGGQWRVLKISCAGVALVTLYYVMPGPALQGYAIDARVQRCESPADSIDSAIQYWDKRISAVTWASPKTDWQNSAREMLQNDHGLVVDVSITKKNRIAEERKPWNRGRIIAAGWEASSEQKSYYIRYSSDSCADYPQGARVLRFTPYDISNLTKDTGSEDWPPRDAADFLNRAVLVPVPDEYRKLIGDEN
jgi:hypothetical protein